MILALKIAYFFLVFKYSGNEYQFGNSQLHQYDNSIPENEKAYESYMIAYSMDQTFSHDKAKLAKELYERTEGKKLKITST